MLLSLEQCEADIQRLAEAAATAQADLLAVRAEIGSSEEVGLPKCWGSYNDWLPRRLGTGAGVGQSDPAVAKC